MILKRDNVERETENAAVIARLKAEGYEEVAVETRKTRSAKAKKKEEEAPKEEAPEKESSDE